MVGLGAPSGLPSSVVNSSTHISFSAKSNQKETGFGFLKVKTSKQTLLAKQTEQSKSDFHGHYYTQTPTPTRRESGKRTCGKEKEGRPLSLSRILNGEEMEVGETN